MPNKLAALTEADRAMVAEAENWLRTAINDPHWQSILPKISIPIKVDRLPAEILREISVTEPFDAEVCLTTAEIPLHLRSAAASVTDPNSITGQLIRAAQVAKRRQHHLEPAKVKAKKTKKTPEQSVAAESKHRSAADTLRRSEKAATIDRQQEGKVIDLDDGDQRSSPASRKRKRNQEDAASGNANRPVLPVPPEACALELGFTTVSSKLDWVVAEVLRNDEDRFLVFAKDSVMLGQLTEVGTGLSNSCQRLTRAFALNSVSISWEYPGPSRYDIRFVRLGLTFLVQLLRRIRVQRQSQRSRDRDIPAEETTGVPDGGRARGKRIV